MSKQTPISSFCAMACNEGGFQKFLTERFDGVYPPCENADQAAEIIRAHCGIESRRELNTKGPEQARWFLLQDEYRNWLRT